jgi:hypothetical protein
VKNLLAARTFESAIRQLVTALTSQTNKGSALYLSWIILQLVSRFALVQSAIMIFLTSEIDAKKKSAFTTCVKRAITRLVPNTMNVFKR